MLMLVTAIALLVMTACGTADTEDNANGDSQGNGTSEVVEENETAVEETETDTEEQVTEEEEGDQAAETEADVIREEAAYVGMADPHTIEVNTETDTIALQILEVEDVNFEEIEENAHVIIEYYENDEGQNILTDIEVQ